MEYPGRSVPRVVVLKIEIHMATAVEDETKEVCDVCVT